MKKNSIKLVLSTFILAIGCAIATKGNSGKKLSYYYENKPGCPVSTCGPVGVLPCGGIFYLVGCTVVVANAKYVG